MCCTSTALYFAVQQGHFRDEHILQYGLFVQASTAYVSRSNLIPHLHPPLYISPYQGADHGPPRYVLMLPQPTDIGMSALAPPFPTATQQPCPPTLHPCVRNALNVCAYRSGAMASGPPPPPFAPSTPCHGTPTLVLRRRASHTPLPPRPAHDV